MSPEEKPSFCGGLGVAAAPTCCLTSHSDSSIAWQQRCWQRPWAGNVEGPPASPYPTVTSPNHSLPGRPHPGTVPRSRGPRESGGMAGPVGGPARQLGLCFCPLPSAPSTRLHPVQDNDLPPLRHLWARFPRPQPATKVPGNPAPPASPTPDLPVSPARPAPSSLALVPCFLPRTTGLRRSWSSCPFTSLQLCLSISLNMHAFAYLSGCGSHLEKMTSLTYKRV